MILNKLYIIFFILSFQTFVLKAQDSTLQNIDAKTYKLYNEQQWGKLIKLSKHAIENNIDYYYLRMRLGIAYYEQKRYNLALEQFKKAKQFDNNDLLNEYLYYSYFFGGNFAEAEELSNSFSRELKTKLGITKPKKVISASIVYAHLKNNDYQKLKDIRINEPYKFTLNNRFRNEINNFYGLDIKFRLNKYNSATFSYGKLIQNKTQIIQNHEPLAEDYSLEEYENKTTQANIYFNLIHSSIKYDWYIGLNFVHVSDNYIKFTQAEPLYTRTEVDERYTDALLHVGFDIKSTFFSVGLNASASNLGLQRQLQFGGTLYIYPKANKNIVIYAMPVIQNISENEFIPQGRRGYYERTTLENNFVIKTGFTTLIYKSLFLDANAYFGRINQFNENIGYLVYNDIDAITAMYTAKLSFNLTKKLNIFVSYSYSEREHEYQLIKYLVPPTIEEEQGTIKISNQNIIGGLKWTF